MRLADYACLLLQADARWRQRAADDKLNRSLLKEVAGHHIEVQKRERVSMHVTRGHRMHLADYTRLLLQADARWR